MNFPRLRALDEVFLSKLTKQKRGQIFNALLIVGTIVAVLYIGAANGNISDAWNAVLTAKPVWVAGAFLSWCATLSSQCRKSRSGSGRPCLLRCWGSFIAT